MVEHHSWNELGMFVSSSGIGFLIEDKDVLKFFFSVMMIGLIKLI